MRRCLLSTVFAACLAVAGQSALGAQTDVALEVGASQIGPPVGGDGESARFGMGGIRASHYSPTGSGLSASLLLGRTLGDPNGGDFLSATIGATVLERLGARWTGGMDLSFLGFGVRAPFPYSAVAVEGGPTLEFGSSAASVKASVIGGLGRSRFELWRVAGGPTRVFRDDLWRLGGTVELLLGSGPVRVGLAGGTHDTPGGTYRSGGGRVLLGGGWGAAELSGDFWSTPLGSQTTGGLALVIPIGGWSLRGFLGRSEPDPLTLAEPGSGSGGFLVGRSLYAREAVRAAGSSPYEVLSETSGTARVRMTIDAPDGARRVELLGDFTLWEPVPMERTDGRWEAELNIPVGTYHYGFLVDDEWHVPDDTRDVVPDEWGRLSAILVIEGVE